MTSQALVIHPDYQAIHDAMWLLGMMPHFTQDELDANYMPLRNLAMELDDTDYLQRLISARNILWPHARPRFQTVQIHIQGPRGPPSPCPSPPARTQAQVMASHFMEVLKGVPRCHDLRSDIGQLTASIQRCQNPYYLQETLNLCTRCVERMAQHYMIQYNMGLEPSWTSGSAAESADPSDFDDAKCVSESSCPPCVFSTCSSHLSDHAVTSQCLHVTCSGPAPSQSAPQHKAAVTHSTCDDADTSVKTNALVPRGPPLSDATDSLHMQQGLQHPPEPHEDPDFQQLLNDILRDIPTNVEM